MDEIADLSQKVANLKKHKEEVKRRKDEEEERNRLQAEEEQKAKEKEKESQEKQQTYSVFVGSVHPKVKKEKLQEFFSCCGEIKRLTIISNPYTHISKGYAYIEFATKAGYENALRLDNSILEGQTLQVKEKKNKDITKLRRGPRRRFRRS